MENIVLIGMPGCGKTTIGKELAYRLKLDFIDVDSYIEHELGKSITEIFKMGEQFFRDLETKALKEVISKHNAVISLGGGVVNRRENRDLIKNSGMVFYIDRSVENIFKDIDISNRPLLKDKKRLYGLYEERKEFYTEVCNYEIKNNLDMESVITAIIEILTSKCN